MERILINDTLKVTDQIKLCGMVIVFGQDLLISLSGGEEHIGAVSYAASGDKYTLVDPPHKEGVLTENIMDIFKIQFPDSRIAVVSGIHYDDIQHDEIEMIVNTGISWAEDISKKIDLSQP